MLEDRNRKKRNFEELCAVIGISIGALGSLGFVTYACYETFSIGLGFCLLMALVLGMPLHFLGGAIGGGLGLAAGIAYETIEEKCATLPS